MIGYPRDLRIGDEVVDENGLWARVCAMPRRDAGVMLQMDLGSAEAVFWREGRPIIYRRAVQAEEGGAQ